LVGSTEAEANQRSLMGTAQTGVAAGRSLGYGTAKVTIRGADVEGVTLRLGSPKTLDGYVRLQDGEPVRDVTVRFEAERFSEAVLLGPVEVRRGEDGRFTFPNAWAATFHVSIAGLPGGTYVESVAYGEQDLLKGPLEYGAPADGRIDVVLSSSAAGAGGVVRRLDGSVAIGAQVFVWAKTFASSDDIRGTSTDRDGRFRMGNLAAGDYYAVSMEAAEIQLMRDPRFREAVLQNSVAVALEESGYVEDLSLQVLSKELVRKLASETRQ
jgi:hypothetical protein